MLPTLLNRYCERHDDAADAPARWLHARLNAAGAAVSLQTVSAWFRPDWSRPDDSLRNLLATALRLGAQDELALHRAISAGPDDGIIRVEADNAPKPVGAYPHARRVNGLLYLSGVGPRQPLTDEIPGGPTHDPDGRPLDYDIEAQTRAVIENVRAILVAAGSSLENVVDVTTFLVDMRRDFSTYNRVYKEYFEPIQPARTTLAITALPTPIAIELKILARP